jgi:ATP-dependent HslUV protease ATP-binding subunit HslU
MTHQEKKTLESKDSTSADEKKALEMKDLTPSVIVSELDKYIIGQQEAKKSVAIALRNRWRRIVAPPDMRSEIMPNNILMIGATGVGKTEIARRLAQLADAPFIKVEASKFTEVGYVGRDVESMVRDLVEYSVNMVKLRHKKECLEKARELAEKIILDTLIPPVKKRKRTEPQTVWEAVASAAESADNKYATESDAELNERTREKFLAKLRAGELDDRRIELEVVTSAHAVQVVGPMGIDAMDGLQDMINSMAPKRKKRRSFTVAEARDYLVEEESQKLIDMDVVVKEAIFKAENHGVIFIDEIDKIVSGNKVGNGPDVSREGVQRDLLPIVEGSVVNTKHGPVKTDHILFIAAGAFHVSRPSDMIPELQGRFPIRVELSPLTREDFIQILKRPRNALTKQYQALLKSDGVELIFEDDALDEIATIAYEVNQQIENIGARRLHTIMSNVLDQILFEVPDVNVEKTFVVNAEYVRNKLKDLARSKDLSEYIL